jgi:hypothetical protein
MSLKIENSRRVAKSRPVCMDLKALQNTMKLLRVISVSTNTYCERFVTIEQYNLTNFA